jgi:polysaccharide biosynthesis transport protein
MNYPSQRTDSTRPPSSVPGRRIQPLRSLAAHWGIAKLTFLIVLIAGGIMAWFKGTHVYQSQAVVLISPRFPKNLDDDKEYELQSNTQYREFVQQNVRTINRYDILEEAIRRLDASPQPYRIRKEKLSEEVERLQGQLEIKAVPDTYQITVAAESKKPLGLDQIVNTVVAVFLERAKDEDFYGRGQRLTSLREDARKLSAEIARDSQEKDELAQELGVSTFSESFSNPFDRLLVGSKEALAAARQKRIAADAQLAALTGGADSRESALNAYARELANRDADLTTLQSNLNLRQSELLAKSNGMLPTHPGKAAIDSELRQINETVQAKRNILTKDYASMLLSQRKAEAASSAQAEAQLQQEVAFQAKQASWYSGNYQKGLDLAYEMERSRHRLEAIEDRIDSINLESASPGFAHVFSSARPALKPIKGGRKKIFLMAGMAAIVLALVVPIGIDMLAPQILSADEAEKILGFTPLGYTYDLGRGEATAITDRIRRLAAALDRDVERNASRSFLFVPINQDRDLSFMLIQLASELERLGRYVQVVLPAQVTGAPLDRPLRQSVESVTNGIVLVAAVPLTQDAETELLAASCDVIVLAIQAGASTKGELRGSIRALERIQPRAVAAMVTGVLPPSPVSFPWLRKENQS